MLNKIQTDLFCIECDKNTSHTVIYLNNNIQRIKCNECGKVFGIDKKKLLEFYTLETVEHILTEPFKLKEELKEKGPQFLFSLSERLFTKPQRTYKEIKEILDDD